jgi:hypothetical protein
VLGRRCSGGKRRRKGKPHEVRATAFVWSCEPAETRAFTANWYERSARVHPAWSLDRQPVRSIRSAGFATFGVRMLFYSRAAPVLYHRLTVRLASLCRCSIPRASAK